MNAPPRSLKEIQVDSIMYQLKLRELHSATLSKPSFDVDPGPEAPAAQQAW
jgi:hypothetical protein